MNSVYYPAERRALSLFVASLLVAVCLRSLWATGCGSHPVVQPQPIDVNHSSLGELTSLPGVGRVTAIRLIRHRPYASLDELRALLGSTRYERIREHVALKE